MNKDDFSELFADPKDIKGLDMSQRGYLDKEGKIPTGAMAETLAERVAFKKKAVRILYAAGVLPSDISHYMEEPLSVINNFLSDNLEEIKEMAKRLDSKYQRIRIRASVDIAVAQLEDIIKIGDPTAANNATRELFNMAKSGKLEDILEGNSNSNNFGDVPDDVLELERELAELQAEGIEV